MCNKWMALMVMVLAACQAHPTPASTQTATPCPPSATPERSMGKEAQVVEQALQMAELEVFVGATGMQNCPGLPATSVAWFHVNVIIDDLTRLERPLEKVIYGWPDSQLQTNATIFLMFRLSRECFEETCVQRFQLDVNSLIAARQNELQGSELVDTFSQ